MRMKTVLVLIDGVRFDAIRLVHRWVGLPTFTNIIRNGAWFNNVYTLQPTLTTDCTAKLLVGHNDYHNHPTIFQRLGQRGLRTASIGTDYYAGRGATTVVDNLYDRFGNYTSDESRADVACRIMPYYDFMYVYMVEPDEYAHIVRDEPSHIYRKDSPYIWAIKRCDERVGQIKRALDSLRVPYNLLCSADHGMTDQGRHSIAAWDDKTVMHIPVFGTGCSLRPGSVSYRLSHITDISHGIISLYDWRYNAQFFKDVQR